MSSGSEWHGWRTSSQNPIRTISVLETLAATGLILPGVTGIVPVLVPIAALELAIVQTGAAIVHLRRSETRDTVKNIVFIALALFVAWGRLGDYPL